MQNYLFAEDWLIRIFLIWVRTSTIFVAAPFWSHLMIPASVRILAALGLSYALVQRSDFIPWPASIAGPGGVILAVLWQVFWGLIIGWIAQLVFAGLHLAGHLAGTMLGFAMASIVDPITQAENPLVSVFFTWLGLMVFLAFNGHHMILLALARSFEVDTLFVQSVTREQWVELAVQAGQFFVFGLRIAAPVVALIILVDFTVALSGKLSPQIPILVISFAIKILAGLMGLGLCLYFFSGSVYQFFTQQMAWLEKWLKAAALY